MLGAKLGTKPSAPLFRRHPCLRRCAALVVVLIFCTFGSTAWAQATEGGPSGGRHTERGWNPGRPLESLAFGTRVTVIGMGAVFLGLLLVYLFMVGLRRTMEVRFTVRPQASRSRPAPEISAEVAHAIALALFMDLRAFDEETAHEVTIRKITRPFSPWMDSGKTRVLLNNQLVFKK